MVSRQEEPGAGVSRHGVEQAADGLGRYRLAVEDVARYEDRVDMLVACERRQPLHRGEACLEQGGRVVGVELCGHAADLPVGGMQETEHQGSFLEGRRAG